MEQSAGMDWDETAFEAALRRAEEGIIDAAGVRISEDHSADCSRQPPRMTNVLVDPD
jgi:hypothetical protein